MTAPRRTADHEASQYVTLGLDRDVFAIPVSLVQEILDVPDMARLPHAPPYLLGIIDVRGHSVPVVDLRVELGRAPLPPGPQTRIIVLDVTIGDRPLILGLMADRVYEVTALDSADLEPPPEIGGRWRSVHIIGVGRRNGGFVIVIDPAQLFAANDLARGDLARGAAQPDRVEFARVEFADDAADLMAVTRHAG